mmetsp:Transcript_7427/g.23337  ORF Transcript_7427/g.23337 Transcript_7427/m.23337 type:complete len:251 (+) Transcript_7427:209-961(+)
MPEAPSEVACLLDFRAHLTHDQEAVLGLENPTTAIGKLQEPCSSDGAPLVDGNAITRAQDEASSSIVRVRRSYPRLDVVLADDTVVPQAALEAVGLCHHEQALFGLKDPAPAVCQVQEARTLYHPPLVDDHHLARPQEVADARVVGVRRRRPHLHVVPAHHGVVPRRGLAEAPRGGTQTRAEGRAGQGAARAHAGHHGPRQPWLCKCPRGEVLTCGGACNGHFAGRGLHRAPQVRRQHISAGRPWPAGTS